MMSRETTDTRAATQRPCTHDSSRSFVRFAGMTRAYLYANSVGPPFAIHREDADTYSGNVLLGCGDGTGWTQLRSKGPQFVQALNSLVHKVCAPAPPH